MKKLSKKENQKLFDAYDHFRTYFEKWLLKSIDVCFDATSKEGNGTPLSAYILLSCAIDTLAGFYTGRDRSYSRKRGKRVKGKAPVNVGRQNLLFIRAYMKAYPAAKLQRGVRNYLVHNFTLRQDILLTHNSHDNHMTDVRIPAGKKNRARNCLLINFEDLLADFKAAYEQYLVDLDTSADLQRKFMRRFRRFGFIGPKDI
jgi:hypothetical protein